MKQEHEQSPNDEIHYPLITSNYLTINHTSKNNVVMNTLHRGRNISKKLYLYTVESRMNQTIVVN